MKIIYAISLSFPPLSLLAYLFYPRSICMQIKHNQTHTNTHSSYCLTLNKNAQTHKNRRRSDAWQKRHNSRPTAKLHVGVMKKAISRTSR